MSATRASATFALPRAHAASSVRCERCGERACDSLAGVPGVLRTECDAAGQSVRVDFDPARVSEADLEAMLAGFGLELAASVGHAAWRITGLD